MRRWGRMDQDGPPFDMMSYWWSVLPHRRIRKYDENDANKSSFPKHYLLFLVLLLLLVTAQYRV